MHRPTSGPRAGMVLALVLSLLAGFWSPTPSVVPAALAVGSTGTNAIWYVGPDGGTPGCPSASIDFTTGGAFDSAYGAIQAAVKTATTGDTIFLCDGFYDLTTGIDVFDAPALSLTFQGESTTGTVVDGGDKVRLFDGTGWGALKDLTFIGLTLTNGSAPGPGNNGGAVLSHSVTLVGVDVTSNTAGYIGGAIAGGIVRTTGGSFGGNEAPLGGAIAGMQVATNGTDFTGNDASEGGGAIIGSLFGGGAVDVTGGTFAENTAGVVGGAILSQGPVSADGTVFRDNSSRDDVGGAIVSVGPVFADGTIFQDNSAGTAGGAIFAVSTVDVTAATFLRNTAIDDGGAVFVSGTAAMNVRRSTFSGNASGAGGGAIYLGGSASGGPISIDASTFDANSAKEGGAVYGGATVASIRNSTFYENTANTGSGGAFFVDAVNVTNGTFVGNSAPSTTGDHVAAATLAADDTIFAAGDCDVLSTSGSGSLDEDGHCAGDALTAVGLNLGGFGDWGGTTKTVKLLSPSDAIDHTNPDGAGACLSMTDQRGTSRPQSSKCDAGAYEAGGVVVAYTGPSVVFTTGDYANVTLSGSTYPALPGCDLEFSVSGGTFSDTVDATVGTKGSGSVTLYHLAADVTYTVTVLPIKSCTGIPEASGVFAIVTSSSGKGTSGGGSYKVDTFSGRVKFAHVVKVSTTTSKVGRTSITTTTTRGSLVWTYKNDWRLKANLSYSSTDGSSTYGLVSCTSGDFSGGSVSTTFPGTCGRFSGAALLQIYDKDAEAWVASSYTNVTFVATVYDGGTKSVCSKTRCTTTDYPDWFGLSIKANNLPLGPSTSPTRVPTSLMRSLASPDGNGSLKAS